MELGQQLHPAADHNDRTHSQSLTCGPAQLGDAVCITATSHRTARDVGPTAKPDPRPPNPESGGWHHPIRAQPEAHPTRSDTGAGLASPGQSPNALVPLPCLGTRPAASSVQRGLGSETSGPKLKVECGQLPCLTREPTL